MIVKHSSDETPKPTPLSLRLARVVSIGNGTVDVSPIGSSVVLHDIPVTSSSVLSEGDVVNLQMIDNRRFAFAPQSQTESASTPVSQTVTLATVITGEGSGGSAVYTAGSGIGIASNVISVDASVVRTSRSVSAGLGLSGGGLLSSNITLSLNTGVALTWTALQQFSAGMSASSGSFGSLSATGNATLAAVTAASGLSVTGSTLVQGLTGSGAVINGILSVTGNSVLSAITGNSGWFNGSLSATGNVAATGNFSATGSGSIGGNFSAVGNGSFGGSLSATGSLAVNANKFTVDAQNGNTLIAGTLGLAGDFSINATRFTVDSQNGNTYSLGTITAQQLVSARNALAVTGDATIVSGGLNVNTTGAVSGQVKAGTGLFSGTVFAEGDITSNAGGFYGNSLNGKNSGAGATLTLTSGSSSSIVLTPGDNKVSLTTGVGVQSSNYQSQTAGMRVAYDGSGDFRYLYSDELHTKSFIADLEQALAGGQIISKSVAMVGQEFTIPAEGATGTLWVVDLPSAPNMAVFQDNDVVGVKTFNRSNGGLQVAWAYGTVSGFATGAADDKGRKRQTWTFTRLSGTTNGIANGGTASGSIPVDSLALDFGTSGNGFHEVNAIDGVNAVNSPYSQAVTWASNPSNKTVRARMGNINGITATTGFDAGLYAGDGASVTAAGASYIRLSAGGTEFRNVPVGFYNSSGNRVISIVPSPTATGLGPYLAVGTTNAPTGYLGNGQRGFWVGSDSGTAKMWLGNVVNGVLENGFSWDGSTFQVSGVINIKEGGNAATTGYATTIAQSASANAYTDATGYALTRSNSASANSYASATGYALTQSNSASANAYASATGNTATKIGEIVDVSDGSLVLNKAPSGSGLFLGAANIGFYINNNWTTHLASSGNFVFRKPFAINDNLPGVLWTSSSGILEGGYFSATGTGQVYGTWVRQWSTDAENGMITAGGGRTTLGASGFSLYNAPADATANTVANLRVRLGELNGTYGYAASTFGFAAGASASTYLTADATNGFRVITAGTQRFQVATGGGLTVGPTADEHIIVNTSDGIRIKRGTTERFLIDSSGNLRINNSAGNAVISMDTSGNAFFAGVVNVATGGEIRQGTGTIGSNFTGLRIWNSGTVGQIAGYNNNVQQWYAGTDGKMYAGSGAVVLGSNGVVLSSKASSSVYPEDSGVLGIKFSTSINDSNSTYGIVYGNDNLSSKRVNIYTYQNTSANPSAFVFCDVTSSSGLVSLGVSNKAGPTLSFTNYSYLNLNVSSFSWTTVTGSIQLVKDVFYIDSSGNMSLTGGISADGELGSTSSGTWIRFTGTFSTNWSNFDSPTESATWSQARYKKVGDMVFVKGLIKRSSGTGLSTTAFTLPSGFRPARRSMFAAIVRQNGQQETATRLDILVDGTVNFTNIGTTAAYDFLSLDGVVFSTVLGSA